MELSVAIHSTVAVVQREWKSAPELEGCWGMVEEQVGMCHHVKLIFLEMG